MFNVRDNISNKTDLSADYEIALVGNPNVGKSTIFNALTGLKQHTGNWTGKTVDIAFGSFTHEKTEFKIIDLPGTYSLLANSDEEIIANEYVEQKKYSCIIIVLDSTNLLRNLNLALQILELTTKVIVCLNFLDEADKKGINIDKDELSLQLGVPVVKTSAKDNLGLDELKDTVLKLCKNQIKTFTVKSLKINISKKNREQYITEIYSKCKDIYNKCVTCKNNYKDSYKIDRFLNKKITGIPILLFMLGVIFWITIFGANYISDALSYCFNYIKILLQQFTDYICLSDGIKSFLLDGIYTTLTWVVAVMLPPMAIFFPIFSLLEDSGFLPRIAFNLDGCFNKVGAHGKQSLTMAMGFGCNACGVMGCRIIDSKREKNIAIITNNFIPCNGRLPSLIAIISIFLTTTASVVYSTITTSFLLILLIILSVSVTMLISLLLSKTILKGQQSSFILEIPPFRKPKIMETIIYALKNRALFVLLRAVTVAIPAGALIWCMANISVNNNTMLNYCSNFLDPFGQLFGLDGVIIFAFILGFPANETVIPIMLMSYLSTSTLTDFSNFEQLGVLLTNNGWTITTALCFLMLCIFHFPCSTTCLTIYKETKSAKITMLSVIIPTLIGLLLCFAINTISLVV